MRLSSDSKEATARKILLNAQGEPLSATTIPAGLTCQGGATVSAEAVFRMMESLLTVMNVP